MIWKQLVSLSTKSKNHLALLEALYDKEIILKKFKKVNYKTSTRIIKEYSTNGLVSKQGRSYSLTNKGRLIACITLGRFNSIKPDLKFSTLFDVDEVYIERADTIQEVLHNLSLKRSTLITGETGMGKTTLLKHLINDYLPSALLVKSRPPMNILETLASHYEIKLSKGKRRKRMYELLDDITRKLSDDLILVVDETEDLTKQSAKVLKTLLRSGCTILAAGTRLKHELNFTEIKLRPLSKEEIASLVSQLLSNELGSLPSEVITYLNSNNGNPERVQDQCQQVKVRHQYGELKPKEIIQASKPFKRVNLISKDGLVNLGYLMITLRYVFYGQKEYQIGYALSTVAYLIFFFFRRRKRKKKS